VWLNPYLLCKREALSSNTSSTKKKKKPEHSSINCATTFWARPSPWIRVAGAIRTEMVVDSGTENYLKPELQVRVPLGHAGCHVLIRGCQVQREQVT
jgi:hypothetical protein